MPGAPVAALADVLDRDPRIAYALVFGSVARGKAHRASDIDVAIGLVADRTLTGLEAGRLVSDLERATGRTVDVVLLHEAPPAAGVSRVSRWDRGERTRSVRTGGAPGEGYSGLPRLPALRAGVRSGRPLPWLTRPSSPARSRQFATP